ncbi:VOC family protein [Actinopolymorpha pittospori]
MCAAPFVRKPAVVFDVSDLERAAAFWGVMLGVEPGRPRSNGEYLTVGFLSEGVLLVLQKVPEPKASKNRVHLDFTVDDVELAVRKINELGGYQLTTRVDGGGTTVSDPDGNEFCIAAFSRSISGERVPG